MSTPTFIIKPESTRIAAALEAWQWLPIDNKRVVIVTSFGDFFLQDEAGIWFLDTIEGTLQNVSESLDNLQKILNTQDGQNRFLLAGLVIAATDQGLLLGPEQCYDFAIAPILGGEISIDNVEVQNFVVAVNIAGQIQNQCKDLPPGSSISNIKIEEPGS